jgi:coatomer subunit beta'
MQTKACIHTIDVFMTAVKYVISIPGRPYLVTCTYDATIHVWSSTDFRLKKTFNFRAYGSVRGLVCLMGSRRIAIGQLYGLAIMDIDDDEEADASEGNNAMGQSSNP